MMGFVFPLSASTISFFSEMFLFYYILLIIRFYWIGIISFAEKQQSIAPNYTFFPVDTVSAITW